MPLNLFYVDDEVELCQNFKELFESSEVSIWTFSDPQQAIESVGKSRPDLMLIDYRFPNTTGDVVAAAVDPKIPKILVTGDITVETLYKFERVIAKPLKSAEIRGILAQYAARKTAA